MGIIQRKKKNEISGLCEFLAHHPSGCLPWHKRNEKVSFLSFFQAVNETRDIYILFFFIGQATSQVDDSRPSQIVSRSFCWLFSPSISRSHGRIRRCCHQLNYNHILAFGDERNENTRNRCWSLISCRTAIALNFSLVFSYDKVTFVNRLDDTKSTEPSTEILCCRCDTDFA